MGCLELVHGSSLVAAGALEAGQECILQAMAEAGLLKLVGLLEYAKLVLWGQPWW